MNWNSLWTMIALVYSAYYLALLAYERWLHRKAAARQAGSVQHYTLEGPSAATGPATPPAPAQPATADPFPHPETN
ncbi:hypothetical protein [Pontibacter mangrovi]|uniref:CcmD family protein n=1 Tax=Pontibacter mangrovi TaxID=2589816 RepID=A0A501VUG2_9BACT|nr:hypothetical protein [Pontibacter mangrovi]TPE39710.1 hypothetical protein FJM65_20710 [Pontibacter mangrovi]